MKVIGEHSFSSAPSRLGNTSPWISHVCPKAAPETDGFPPMRSVQSWPRSPVHIRWLLCWQVSKRRKGLRWACLVSFPKLICRFAPRLNSRWRERLGTLLCKALAMKTWDVGNGCYLPQYPSFWFSYPLNLLFTKLFVEIFTYSEVVISGHLWVNRIMNFVTQLSSAFWCHSDTTIHYQHI